METSPGRMCVTYLLLLVITIDLVEIGEVSCKTPEEYVLEVNEIIKSEDDMRAYKYVTLKNKLRVMLVSDPTSEKAAAAVTINAGYSSDPESVPGIAHFCEHMLFLGTKKYPKESGFGLFLSQHNGRTNAYTSSQFTTYYFDINAQFLEPALDRFAQFFISPTFNQNATDRELNAIDQEHQKNILDDYRRIYYIERASAKPGHKYGVFGTGNIDTLKTIPLKKGISIRDKLLEFYAKYYSANIMSVAVVGKESLKDLEKMVVPLFKEVKNSDVILPSFKDNLPYGKDELGIALKIPTIKEMNRLEMKFQILYLSDYYRAKPADYLSQVIGHEGKGSLLSLLKEKGWAYALWAGDRSGLKGFEFFIIGMDLTKEGLTHVDDIIGITFQYINMLKRDGPKQWIYDEMRVISNNRFRFKDKEHAQRYVQTLAKDIQLYSPVDVLYGHYQYNRFMPDLITDILNSLTPTKFRYFLASQSFKNQTNNKKVQYFNAEYVSEKIPQETINKWQTIGYNDRLHLPQKNPFIPESLSIVVPKKDVKVKAVPALIKDNQFSRVWHKADDTFYVPKASIKIAIYSPHASMTPSHLNHLNAFIRLVRDAMVEYGYDAELADVRYNIRWLFTGLLVNVEGFSNKQGVLMKKILGHITSLEIKEETFLLIKQQLLEALNNMDVSVPYRQTEEMRNYVMNEVTWSSIDRLKYMDDLTVESLKTYIKMLLKDIYIESLYCGNILKKDALKIQTDVEQMLINSNDARPMLPMQHTRSREFNIPPGYNYLVESRSKLHAFSAVQIYLQVGMQEERTNVLCELFWHMIYSPIFSTLRTKQQLGYIVFSGLSRSHSVQGLRIQVQSDKSPAYVEGRIDAFLKNFEKTLNKMSEEEFKKFIESTVVRKLEKPKRIGYEASIYAMEIFIKHYHFRRGEKEVEHLKKLKKKDIIRFYKKYIDPSSPLRKKLAIVVLGQNATSLNDRQYKKNWTAINDVTAFKTSLPLYQHIMPYNGIPLLAKSDKKG